LVPAATEAAVDAIFQAKPAIALDQIRRAVAAGAPGSAPWA